MPLPGYGELAKGWVATLDVELTTPGAVAVLGGGGSYVSVAAGAPRQTVRLSACGGPRVLALDVGGEAGRAVTLWVTPHLALTHCP